MVMPSTAEVAHEFEFEFKLLGACLDSVGLWVVSGTTQVAPK